MGEDAGRWLYACGHQEGRPVDRVKAQDVLAHHVQVGGPVGLPRLAFSVRESGGADVVGERIEPHVHGVVGSVRHGNAPFQARARNGEVVQPTGNEADDLVAAALGCDRLGILLVEFEQRLLPVRKAEEIARLFHPFDRRAVRHRHLAAIGAVPDLRFGAERLLPHRVPARILAEVDVAIGLNSAPQLLARTGVTILRGADEVVVAVAHDLAEGAKPLRDLVDEVLRLHAGGNGGFLDLLTMLVSSGEEHHVAAVESHEAGQHVAGERRIGMPDVGRIVHIVDRCAQVVGRSRRHGFRSCRLGPRGLLQR